MKMLTAKLTRMIFGFVALLCACNTDEQKAEYKIMQFMNYDAGYFVCESTTGCMVTEVWKGKKLLAMECDHPNKFNDSVRNVRLKWAKEFILVDKARVDTTIIVQ